jgi:hypothetical protein
MEHEIFIALKIWIVLFCVMTPCVLVGITTYRTYGSINHLTIALCNLTFIYQVVTQGGSRLSAYKMTTDQSEPGGHVRSADEEPSASNQIVVHTDEEKSSDHIPGFLILM